ARTDERRDDPREHAGRRDPARALSPVSWPLCAARARGTEAERSKERKGCCLPAWHRGRVRPQPGCGFVVQGGAAGVGRPLSRCCSAMASWQSSTGYGGGAMEDGAIEDRKARVYLPRVRG